MSSLALHGMPIPCVPSAVHEKKAHQLVVGYLLSIGDPSCRQRATAMPETTCTAFFVQCVGVHGFRKLTVAEFSGCAPKRPEPLGGWQEYKHGMVHSTTNTLTHKLAWWVLRQLDANCRDATYYASEPSRHQDSVTPCRWRTVDKDVHIL